MAGPRGDSVTYEYPSPPLLHPEVDGVRIVSRDKSELLQRVFLPSERVFIPGSAAPSARLLEASFEFDKGSPRAEDLLNLLEVADKYGEAFASAVVDCVHAARHEPVVHTQKILLQAAIFGKAYCTRQIDKNLLASTCATVRILNCAAPRFSKRASFELTINFCAIGVQHSVPLEWICR